MSGVKEPEPERRPIRRALAESDPDSFDEIDLNSLVVGAAIRFVEQRQNGDIVIDLTGNRQLIVPDRRIGAHLQCDLQDTGTWSLPLPIVVERIDEHGFGQYLNVLDAIHTLFAVILLLNTDREAQLRDALGRDPTGRGLREMIGPDQITLASSAAGSWYIDLIPKTKEAFKALFVLAMSVTPAGRVHLQRRLEAATKMQESKADLAEIEVEERRIKLTAQRARAIQEQVKAATSLAELQRKHLSKLPVDDPVRRTVEQGLLVLTRDPPRPNDR